MLHRDTSRIASDTGASGGYTWLLISGTLGISVRGRIAVVREVLCRDLLRTFGVDDRELLLSDPREHHGELARHAKLGYLSKLLQSRIPAANSCPLRENTSAK